jgi:hypothetical protein
MTVKRSLVERLNQEGAICAEGFLFEMERRGYLTAENLYLKLRWNILKPLKIYIKIFNMPARI